MTGTAQVMANQVIQDIMLVVDQINPNAYPKGCEFEFVESLPENCGQPRDPVYSHIYTSLDGDVYYFVGSAIDSDKIRKPVFAKLKPQYRVTGSPSMYLPKQLKGGKYVDLAKFVLHCFGKHIHYTQYPIHIDGNLRNCALENLQLPATAKEAAIGKQQHGINPNPRNSKLTPEIVIGLRYLYKTCLVPPIKLVKAVHGQRLSYPGVYAVVTGRTWSHVEPENPTPEDWERVKGFFADEFQNLDGWNGLD